MDSFNLETTSIWSFKDRGDWSTHKGDYPGNCSPRVVRNLLLKYTKENDIVLDQFVGSGTTAIESLLLDRRVIGIDINERAIEITLERIKNLEGSRNIILGNAEILEFPNNSIDFICTHPPYLDIIKYSKNTKGDISLLGKEEYFKSIYNV